MNDSVEELHGVYILYWKGITVVEEGLNADFAEHVIDVTGMVVLHQSVAVIRFCPESLSFVILGKKIVCRASSQFCLF